MHSIRKAASRASGKSGFFSGKSKQTVERADLEEAPEPTATADISAQRHRGFPYKFGDPSEVSSASTMRRTDGAAWLAVGATVDALDEYPGVKTGVLQRKWRVANVVRLGDGHDDERAAKVAYEGYASPKWDAWLPRHRLAPPGTHTRGGEAVFVKDLESAPPPRRTVTPPPLSARTSASHPSSHGRPPVSAGRAAPPPPALRRALSEEGRELLCDALGARAQTSHQPGPHKLPSEMDASDFLCPISREVMLDPVIAADGHTYERDMITEWLRIRRTSPLTNERLASDALIPNLTLKKVIDAWNATQRGGPADDGAPPPGVVIGKVVTPRGSGFDSPHLVEVHGDELDAIKQSVYSAYASNDEVCLIRRVAKVNNAALTGAFNEKKRALRGRTRRLFHGTLEQSAQSIAATGFKVPEQFERADDLQETGQLTFGKAVYFSERADLACAFGEATLVIADVALGREWNASQSLPHLDAERMRTQGKDSVVFGRTHEYAVYEESQAVPLYVVTYLLVASASLTEAYDRASLEAMYERVTDARSVDWGLVLKHVGAEGRPRQRHVALRKLGDICRDDQAATCALLPAALLRALKEQCLTLEAAEEDAPVTWLALRLCWNVAYKNPPMQRSLVDKVGAGTFTALLAHWNNDVVDRACGVILNLVQRSASARKAFWAVEAPMALAKLVSKNANKLLHAGPGAGQGAEPVPLALGAIANLAFAEDVKAKFMRSPRLRTFLMTVAEPLMDSWSEEVREEATRLFSCLIAEGHAPKEWLEQGGDECFQKSAALEERV